MGRQSFSNIVLSFFKYLNTLFDKTKKPPLIYSIGFSLIVLILDLELINNTPFGFLYFTAVNVAIGTDPVATTSDYYIPSGGSAVLGITKASQAVESITKGSTTTITCPEGTQMPFSVGNRVTLTDANDSNWTTLINDTKVLTVDSTTNTSGYFRTRLTVEANTSGISTAFSLTGASLVSSLKVSAIPNGAAAGSIWVQQVQVSGDA